MPEVYVSLSAGDVERKMLEKAGFMEVNKEQESTLEPVECPRCKSMNTHDAMYFARCSIASLCITLLQVTSKKGEVLSLTYVLDYESQSGKLLLPARCRICNEIRQVCPSLD